ncbi:hypothetical protein [Streptomyces deccanensis]|uniref:hypothetical protein n=1 Tax=Streptomyces deccanensis TaxID=424188 RepID=UPI001EFBC850|nr:hypothetical protein [Streptomyces deccanensis]ULR51203.1 hypothetical protein L3078_18925 [Streptomyces deccanensis]
MAHPHSKYADFEALRERAITLRREGLSRRQIRDRLHVDNNDILNRLLEGEPPPEWTKRPNAKDDLKARARDLRLQGWTYDQIQLELGCSKSSISLWVRDLPKPEPRYTPEEQQALMREGLAVVRQAQATERRNVKVGAAKELGSLTDRELFVLGVGLYWAEGAKSKPYARREAVNFINSDPDMINTFLAWLDLLGVERKRLRFRVMIHESADITAAETYWADLVGVDRELLQPTTLKKHNPKTVRKNTGEDYRGCLVIRVQQGGDLYCRIEGWWKGIAADVAVRLR